jgi:hypothetical protein
MHTPPSPDERINHLIAVVDSDNYSAAICVQREMVCFG